MRKIKTLHKARYTPIADLVTYNVLPSPSLPQIDPFLFLNHHGPQVYKPNNNGLPFGPHPHRGMETVTFIIEGDIMHQDSAGHESVIEAGGVQWMTAGRGLIHAEVSSTKFKKEGGPLEILQLWLNLPAKHKMTAPQYTGLQKNEIPMVQLADGVEAQCIAGGWQQQKPAFETISDVTIATLYLKKGSSLSLKVAAERNIFFYMIRGEVMVNEIKASMLHLVEFTNQGEDLVIETLSDSIILFGHAVPFNEPMVAHGPFVMNTMEEIQQAYADYQAGKFGN
ncbi:pirin family protein [Chryseotalea sanaruensis]|nr:pirin family protein [Chryseotalea sanaruensis]